MPSKSPVTRLLSDLVSIPSINPSLAPSNSKLTGEEGIATLLADQAGKLGVEIKDRQFYRVGKIFFFA
jgi:acetylornithine deacetylase/succinyl-diaminopimelate desuccinylase-like protein